MASSDAGGLQYFPGCCCTLPPSWAKTPWVHLPSFGTPDPTTSCCPPSSGLVIIIDAVRLKHRHNATIQFLGLALRGRYTFSKKMELSQSQVLPDMLDAYGEGRECLISSLWFPPLCSAHMELWDQSPSVVLWWKGWCHWWQRKSVTPETPSNRPWLFINTPPLLSGRKIYLIIQSKSAIVVSEVRIVAKRKAWGHIGKQVRVRKKK